MPRPSLRLSPIGWSIDPLPGTWTPRKTHRECLPCARLPSLCRPIEKAETPGARRAASTQGLATGRPKPPESCSVVRPPCRCALLTKGPEGCQSALLSVPAHRIRRPDGLRPRDLYPAEGTGQGRHALGGIGQPRGTRCRGSWSVTGLPARFSLELATPCAGFPRVRGQCRGQPAPLPLFCCESAVSYCQLLRLTLCPSRTGSTSCCIPDIIGHEVVGASSAVGTGGEVGQHFRHHIALRHARDESVVR